MLNSREHGYSVVSPQGGITFSHPSLEACKRVSRTGDKIVEQVPTHTGYNIEFSWNPWWFRIVKTYSHVSGEIINT